MPEGGSERDSASRGKVKKGTGGINGNRRFWLGTEDTQEKEPRGGGAYAAHAIGPNGIVVLWTNDPDAMDIG